MLNKITLHITHRFPSYPHQMPKPPKAFGLPNLEEPARAVIQTQNLTPWQQGRKTEKPKVAWATDCDFKEENKIRKEGGGGGGGGEEQQQHRQATLY